MLACLWSGDAVAAFAAALDEDAEDPYVARLLELATRNERLISGTALEWWNVAPTAEARTLIETWERAWPGGHPIADELKHWFPDRWVRFHSLPESKRYADTSGEYDEILRRHNTVLTELCGPDAGGTTPLLVVSIEVEPAPTPPTAAACPGGSPTAAFWAGIPWPALAPDLYFGHLYVDAVSWRPGRLDDLLLSVADEVSWGILIAPPDLAWLYHPYDGGADVLLPDRAGRDEVMGRHQDWLSAHPCGF